MNKKSWNNTILDEEGGSETDYTSKNMVEPAAENETPQNNPGSQGQSCVHNVLDIDDRHRCRDATTYTSGCVCVR